LPVSGTRVEPLNDDDTDKEYDERTVNEAVLFSVMLVRNDKAKKLSETSRDSVIRVRIEKERNLLVVKGRRYGNYTVPTPS
jgi:hypothetical protein